MTSITASASLSSISASASFPTQTVTGGVTPSGILYQRPVFCGQTTSYANYDVGWHLTNNTYDYTRPANPATVAELDTDAVDPFRTLKENNAFGNTNRFTDSVGAQNYDGTGGSVANYAIDHLTGLGWWLNRVSAGATNWANALTTANGSTNGSFSDWRLPTSNELLSIVDIEDTLNFFNYSPFTIGNLELTNNVYFWTNETPTGATSQAYALGYVSGQQRWNNTANDKTTSSNRVDINVRNHY